MTNEEIVARIREICSHYEDTLEKARASELNSSSREMVNVTRHEALNEICELVKEI